MFGIAQLVRLDEAPDDASTEDRATSDDCYDEKWSLRMDVRIVLRTVEWVIGRQGG